MAGAADQLEGQLPGWGLALLAQARIGHLGLVDDQDRPRVMPVTFAVHAEAVWSAVDDKPKRAGRGDLARVRFLRRQPHAALTVDVYDDDWSKLAWVQVLGEVEVIERGEDPGQPARGALEALAAKYPPYRERRPPGPLLRLVPRRALHWRASGA